MNREHVIDRAIVIVGPFVRVGAGVDQLRVHTHFVAGALNAALQHVSDAKLLSDFAEITRNAAFVLHHRSAADHFEICYFGQGRQNLVLHAVGKEGVVRIAAEVFKRQDRNAFFGNSLRLADFRRRRNQVFVRERRPPPAEGDGNYRKDSNESEYPD